ncbi:FIST N-terminal domain-containing protein [uncultured Dokdonia sp.]|uniref:FIST signal transduction protein n=1 Tax=uncultured Dokdonia sp. TaxID=575653 RepID=UPI0030EE3319|tara:strand:+ start:56125 stop:57255 length:1131 start_codon:yes stop_codon:yes gene_type:complete
MKTVQLQRDSSGSWNYLSESIVLNNPLVLILGNRFLLEKEGVYEEVRDLFPSGHLVFGSSSGEIVTGAVNDNHITITAIEFEKSSFEIQTFNIHEVGDDSEKAGFTIVKKLTAEGLKHVFVLSEGSFVNGSALTKGMQEALPNVLITGGLCGDDARFEKTLASYNAAPKEGEIVVIGFYGATFEASFSIYGGWTPFGPERLITKSDGNILYEIDGKPALDLYKTYLGDKAKDLPGSALIYPLNVRSKENDQSFVRTILNIDEEKNAMILAGDVPEQSKVQLMMTNMDSIASASETAALRAMEGRNNPPQLALLISCIGRKLVLDQRIEEEVEEVMSVIGDDVVISGMYSYGEIAPFYGERSCKLHNQTMTITLISE